jgi:hypothetical protein
MNNKNLLASIALLGELYKSDKKESLWDILADYIKGAVSFENKYTLTSVEVKELLSKVYGFDKIPESVIRTTLKSKLKDCAKSENGSFNFDANSCADTNKTIENVKEINKKQQSVLEKLYNYILEKKNLTNKQLSKDSVWEQLSNFLLNNDCIDNFYELISSFIIHNNNGENDCLNQIKEGLILYNGLCDSETEDINQLGSWKNELTIYLSTEHLFNSVGYNGDVYKEIFDDFKNLVNEINRSEKGDNKKGIIHLKFFEETKREVDNFFLAAENIIKYHQTFDQTKTAMVSILKGCKRIDDVKEKQAKFYVALKQKNIEIQEYSFDRIKAECNVDDDSVIKALKDESEANHKFFDEDYCIQSLRMFSKINNQRSGINNVSFERVKYIYVTENRFALYLGHNNKVKFNDTDISFAKDIDYVITKFWFKLNKGFGRNTTLPKSLDVLTRARLVISSRISNSLSEKYDELNKKIKDGSLTKEEAIELHNQYKETPSLPENIDSTNIDDTFAFLYDDNFIENHLREKAKQEQKRQEQEVKLQETESENQTIKAENKETKSENQSLKEQLAYYKQQEDARNEKTQKEKIEKESDEYAVEEWKKLKYYRDLLYVLFWVVLAVVILCICSFVQTIHNFIKDIDWYWQTIITLIIGAGLPFVFKKEKFISGWKYLFKHKSIKNTMIENFKNDYIGQATPK